MAIITISRGSLSGGELLAQQLSARLGARVISREVIVEAAKRYGVSEEKLLSGLESPPGFWERLTHLKERYLIAVQATLAGMVQNGNIIYHGLAGQMLLKPLSKVIKLRLIAPLEYRIRSAMLELNLSREKATQHIVTVDERRAKWVHQMYDVEWNDPALYDMVLNLELMSIETATEMVANLAARAEYRRDPDLERERQDFALKTRVRAEIAFHSDFSVDDVDVEVSGGVVRLSGGAAFARRRDTVVRFVRGIEGVAEVATAGEDTVPGGASPGEGVAEEKARDVMLPVSSYPFIHQWISIREAMSVLATSSVKLRDGHVISPRYILVHDEAERTVGVITRRSLLRGLVPQLRIMERAQETIGQLAHVEVAFPMMTFRWMSMFSPGARSMAKDRVETVMSPIRASVRPDDDLSAVVATMLQAEVDLVPVIDGQKTVGVILMTDLFDTVAQHIIEQGA